MLLPALVPAQTLVQPLLESHGETESTFKLAYTETSKHVLLGYFLTQIAPQSSSEHGLPRAGVDTSTRTAQVEDRQGGWDEHGAGAGRAALRHQPAFSISSQPLLR